MSGIAMLRTNVSPFRIFTQVHVEINLEYAAFEPPEGEPSRFDIFNTAELAIFGAIGIFFILFHVYLIY
uniref:Uncharacterized protein n=1 Tax=Glossina pallidipes TaxID=7398 RepID=A0A1A9Z2I8_GLOPL